MTTCRDCGAPVNVVQTSSGPVALDERMDPDGDDRFIITAWEAQPHPTAEPVSANYPRDCFVAHRKVCPFTT